MSSDYAFLFPGCLPLLARHEGTSLHARVSQITRSTFVSRNARSLRTFRAERPSVHFEVNAAADEIGNAVEKELQKARDASVQFGSDSKQAAAAWDAVEELEAEVSHQRSALKGGQDGDLPFGKQKAFVAASPEDVSDLVLRIQKEISRARALTDPQQVAAAWDAVEELMASLSDKSSTARPGGEGPFSGNIPTITERDTEDKSVRLKLDKGIFKAAYDPSAAEAASVETANLPPTEQEVIVQGKIERAVARAREAVKKFGESSKEAATYWDLVEELEATASHLRDKKSKSEPTVVFDTTYVEATKRDLTEDEVKLQGQIQEEMSKARSATEKFGSSSKEAAAAWDAVEELEATLSHSKSKPA
mmetsp:Transcript_2151/g.3272  ORF Transcript_2151/g.3272 Transcript_2151/m.3272 type:complete len:363 (-) Transcript_2151:536-1624(-)|eukprot:CAMPEP_0184656136 /NCGR_PEP_ID=MMETSP0308-20130426/15720_1 /TAXON_ID=38269 /ORGANISM="Gloeochaete witrockiana, Strain SAG 46.84" /LENGTH=362 /DNA_ID=CAMNT_0027093093 /DNA_START=59 /DNA_END=1147 /DNA_ORIENTATION=-